MRMKQILLFGTATNRWRFYGYPKQKGRPHRGGSNRAVRADLLKRGVLTARRWELGDECPRCWNGGCVEGDEFGIKDPRCTVPRQAERRPRGAFHDHATRTIGVCRWSY
jgi:hypothetical protein